MKITKLLVCPQCKGSNVILDSGGITGKFRCKNCGYVGIALELPFPNFRYFFTSSGLLVLCGKNAEQNEELIKKYTNKDDYVLHTKSPGSPFCVIKGKPKAKDLREAANFCACFSKAWKEGKKKIEVDVFIGKDMYKEREMPEGTFGVKKILKKILVKPKLFVNVDKGLIEILPYKKKDVAIIEMGKKERDEIMKEITSFAKKNKFGLSNFLLLPAHNLKIRWKNKK